MSKSYPSKLSVFSLGNSLYKEKIKSTTTRIKAKEKGLRNPYQRVH